MKKLTKKQEQALELLKEGKSLVGVALVVLGSKRKESTIRYWKNTFLQEYLDQHDAEKADQVAEEEVSAVDAEILESLCNNPDKDIASLAKRLRTAQRTNAQLRKIQRNAFDSEVNVTAIKDSLAMLSESLNVGKLKSGVIQTEYVAEQSTVEILFSDLQIGKVNEEYNTEVAKRAMRYYEQELMKIIQEHKPERIVCTLLGDNVEDHLKHGVQSAISTDTGLAEQMANAIELMWHHLISPLSGTGVPVDVHCLAGNHGSSEHKGMDMFKAGRYCYDYTIYKALELLCKETKADQVRFTIPEGCFTTYDIYGKKYLADHGYFTKGVSQEAMEKMKEKRMNNLKTYIHGYRMGDKHNVRIYDAGNYILNGSFFGIETTGQEYSGILGFNSIPAQVVAIHKPIPEGVIGQTSVAEVKMIQTAKGYDFGL